MSAEIIDLGLARAKATIGTPAHIAWDAFVAAKLRAEATLSLPDMRAAVQAYDAMLAAFGFSEEDFRDSLS